MNSKRYTHRLYSTVMFLFVLGNLMFGQTAPDPRCYVQTMNGTDPMITENVNLSDYDPLLRQINIKFIEYKDPNASYQSDEAFWQARLVEINDIFAQASLNFIWNGFQQHELSVGSVDYFDDCQIPPIDEALANESNNQIIVCSMPPYVRRLVYDEENDEDDVYGYERGSVNQIFGHVVYVSNHSSSQILGNEVAFYIAQALGLYETDETHFGETEGDLLDDTDPDDDNNLMKEPWYPTWTGGTQLSTQQQQRLQWAITTRTSLLPIIEIEVDFANIIDGYDAGGTLHYDDNTVSSSTYHTLLEGSTYDIGTDQQIISQHQHLKWNDVSGDYLLSRDKRINRTENRYYEQHAEFDDIFTIDVTSDQSVMLEIKDPWWVDPAIDDQHDPPVFNALPANGEYQVFLNQDPDIVGYILRAQDTYTGSDLTWYFDHWSASGGANITSPNSRTTAVVFTSSGATVTAHYKPHMHSRTTLATAHNNGPKAIYYDVPGSPNDGLHLIYADNDKIYHTSSSDEGTNWSRETLVIDDFEDDYGWKNPSVVINPLDSDELYAAMEQDEGGDQRFLGLAYYNGADWSEVLYGLDEHVLGGDIRPSLAIDDLGNCYIVFRGDPDNSIATPNGIKLLTNSHTNSFRRFHVSGSNANSKNPSVLAINSPQVISYASVIWEENDDIYENTAEIDHYGVDWGTKYSLSADYPGPLYHRNPSSATDGDNIYVAWETREWVERECPEPRLKTTAIGCGTYWYGIYVRRKGPNGWNYPLQKFLYSSSSTKSPVLSLSPSSTANDPQGALVYRKGSSIYFSELDNGNWSTATDLGSPGTYPTVAAGSNGNHVIYTNPSSSPYPLEAVTPPPPRGKTTVTASDSAKLLYWREVTLDLSQMQGGNIQPGDVLGSVRIALPRIEAYNGNGYSSLKYESAAVDSTGIDSDWFTTQPFPVSADVQYLTLNLTIYTQDFTVVRNSASLSNRPLIKVWLNSTNNGGHRLRPLQLLRFGDLPESTDTSAAVVIPVVMDVRRWAGQSLYLSADLVGRSENVPHHYAEVYLYPDSTDMTELFRPKIPSTTDLIPEVFAIYDNFPNPFNPTTTILYDLPEPGRVTITIYDVRGRQIKTLVNGMKAAGCQQVRWDGTDNTGNPVASGMYLYTLTAVSNKSDRRFTESRKMILLK